MGSEKLGHLYERQAKQFALRTWERRGWSLQEDQEELAMIRYTIYDATTGHTAYHRMVFNPLIPRRHIARELRNMRAELKALVSAGPRP